MTTESNSQNIVAWDSLPFVQKNTNYIQPIVFIQLFFIALGLLIANPSHAAEDWQLLSSAEANASFAIDKASIVRMGPKVRFWERTEFQRPEQIDEASGLPIKYKRVQRLIDCSERTQGVLRGSIFSEKGKLIEALTNDPAQVRMIPVPPQSIGDKELEIVCGTRAVPAAGAAAIPLVQIPANPAITDKPATALELLGEKSAPMPLPAQ